MKHLSKFFFTCGILYNFSVLAQKPDLDTSILGKSYGNKWPVINEPALSSNGKYALYKISQQQQKDVLILQATNGNWKKQITNVSQAFFADDGKIAIYQIGDSILMLKTGMPEPFQKIHITSMKHPLKGNMIWIAYQLYNSKSLVVQCLAGGRKIYFDNIDDYEFDDLGKSLIIKTKDPNEKRLQIVDLSNGRITKLWSSGNSASSDDVEGYSFDHTGTKLLFYVDTKDPENGSQDRAIWYYSKGMNKANFQIDSKTDRINKGYRIGSGLQFSANSKYIFFNVNKEPKKRAEDIYGSKVDVWSYKDSVLQPDQIRRLSESPPGYQAVTTINAHKVVFLTQKQETMALCPPSKITGDFAVVTNNLNNAPYWWTISPKPTVYLVSLKDGKRKILKDGANLTNSLEDFSYSPNGRFLVYFDCGKGNYYSYDLITNTANALTKDLPVTFFDENGGHYKPIRSASPVLGWSYDGKSLLICDNYDIWMIDPSQKNKPINITNGYGLKNKIKFRLLTNGEFSIIYYPKDKLYLSGFNVKTKDNGFFKVNLKICQNPEQLTMGPYTYCVFATQKAYRDGISGMLPIKAECKNAWVIQRESCTEYPNLYYTNNLKNLIQLSDLQPQKRYNWITSELVEWTMFDGEISQGILYKPENFDARNKYPVIFNYYEQRSFELNNFLQPRWTEDNINIPWFVSHGYLVFVPDIHYKQASISNKTVGDWAYNSVVSAAKYLSEFSYVDKMRLGLQGHSFGGLETAYLATHSNLFSAACEAAGSTDPVSRYLTLIPFLSKIEYAETSASMEVGHENYGATPWERPDLYERSSAVLSADQTKVPILIMHNQNDNQVQWRQGIEFYMALRRLGKKVWMLQYDNGGHFVNGPDAVDYTTRLSQFFDYYLKGSKPPVWMTQGVPASSKGFDSGLKYDESGAIP